MSARIYTASEAAALLAAAEAGPYTAPGEDGIVWPALEAAFDPIGAVASRLDEAQGAANGALLAASWDLAASVVRHAERADRAEAEIERLRAELAKPVLLPWLVWHRMDPTTGAIVARSTPMGWSVAGGASGPETGEEGRRLADEAATAAGWRLL